MIARLSLGVATAGFAASALAHLATFTPLAARLSDGPVLFLFALAFAPLGAMLARLRRGTATRPWRRLRYHDWRAAAALVPAGMRWLVAGAAMYALMNLGLSLLLVAAIGGDSEAQRAVTLRLLSGHLLLFYLLPLVYFRFADGPLAAGAGAGPAAADPRPGGPPP